VAVVSQGCVLAAGGIPDSSRLGPLVAAPSACSPAPGVVSGYSVAGRHLGVFVGVSTTAHPTRPLSALLAEKTLETEDHLSGPPTPSSPHPRVSIGMPVYNGENFIRTALESLLAQTFTNFELIISDNASTDATEIICRQYALQDSRIKYFRQPENLGPSNNFKFVFSRASAKYFMWAACDDMWDQSWLEKCVEILDRDEQVVLVFSNMKLFSHVSGFLKNIYVVPSFGTPTKRLGIRFIDCCANLIYGIFRRTSFDESLIKQIDFWDVYFGNFMALQGDIYILNDFLFHAGIKNENAKPYSIMGDKIRIIPYFKLNIKLIYSKLSGFYRFPMTLILLKQAIGFYKAYR
jgi:glycosyltransferase involved in cell wall biosynthesis